MPKNMTSNLKINTVSSLTCVCSSGKSSLIASCIFAICLQTFLKQAEGIGAFTSYCGNNENRSWTSWRHMTQHLSAGSVSGNQTHSMTESILHSLSCTHRWVNNKLIPLQPLSEFYWKRLKFSSNWPKKNTCCCFKKWSWKSRIGRSPVFSPCCSDAQVCKQTKT